MAVHSPSTSETTIDRKVGPVSTRSDIEAAAAALPGVLEVESLTKSVMYNFLQCVFERQKKMANSCIRRKVDWRMLPLLGILSALSLIDRSNLGLARASGMDHDLVCLFFFYIFMPTWIIC
jgi:hypothetical protein